MGVTYTDMYKQLKEAQEVETDNRERMREIDHFVNKKDGQWEPDIISRMTGRPRYTFDRCNMVIDSIMGDIEQSDFASKVLPGGGGATKDIAKKRNGIIRKLEQISKAKYIYNQAARGMVTMGMSGWRVVQAWADSKTFHQDLLIKRVSNFADRVWYDPGAEEPDMSDADWCFLLSSLTMEDYLRDFPKGSRASVGTDLRNEVYSYKKTHEVIIGEYLYKKRENKEIILMSNGHVYVDDEEYKRVKDDLGSAGITETRRRKTNIDVVHQKIFDGKDWLTDEKRTVFQYLPVVPVYGNFEISERKVIYKGAIESLMDPQRVLNYAESRKIEEGALAPREKIMMTRKQAKSDTRTLRTMNTNSDPVQFYTHVDNEPAPYKINGPSVNPALTETTQAMGQHINQTAGLMQPDKQYGLGVQSGEALEVLENKEKSANYKYFQSMEIAISHTCRIMNDSIPEVYDTDRQVMVLNSDGSEDEITINERVVDQPSGEVVEMNNLAQGVYSVVCTSGPAFQNQQQETVNTMLKIGAIDQSVMQIGSDVLLNNINAPGIDQLAERKRAQLLQAGVIPESQMTDDEKEQMAQAQAQQGQKQDPMAEAMLMTAQAEMKTAQAKAEETMSKMQERIDKTNLETQKLVQRQQELQLKAEKQQMDAIKEQGNQFMGAIKLQTDQLKTQAETLKLIKDSMGVDAIVGPGNTKIYGDQVKLINDTQDGITQPE